MPFINRFRLAALAPLLCTMGTSAQAPKQIPYTWKSVQIVGGGFVDGIIFHPTAKDVRYARTDSHFFKETKLKARGVLVHGGSKKLHADVEAAASKSPKIEVIQHRFEVEFSRCN